MYEIEPADTRPHRSGFGTASLVIGILTLVGALALFVMLLSDASRLITAVGVCGGGMLAVVGIGLGIAGAVQSRSKAVSILGIILNALFVSLSVVALLVLLLQAYTPGALP